MTRRGSRTHIGVAAWHEAGHALAAMREGRWVVAVEVCETVPGSGVTRQLVRRRRNRFNPALGPGNARASWEDSLSRSLSDLRVILAGPLAEARAINRPLRAPGAVTDFEKCRHFVMRLEALREFVESVGVDCGAPIADRFNEERGRVCRWLAHPVNWLAIEKIACQLMSNHRITAREVFACYLEARSSQQLHLGFCWDGDDRLQAGTTRSNAA